jgi:hypothetical protein
MMRAVGIRRVYYSIDNDIVYENVTQMVSINASSVLRFLERQMYNAPTSDREYFVNLLLRKMPKSLRTKNIICFISYNFLDVLPEFSYTISKNNFRIFDERQKMICHVDIIN